MVDADGAVPGHGQPVVLAPGEGRTIPLGEAGIVTLKAVSAGTGADEALPVACGLDDAALAARSDEVRRDLFAMAEETRELADGYAFRFAAANGWAAKLLDFVEAERRCCSFFRFELAFEPNLGPIWLRLSGPEGTKPFIRRAFGPDTTSAENRPSRETGLKTSSRS